MKRRRNRGCTDGTDESILLCKPSVPSVVNFFFILSATAFCMGLKMSVIGGFPPDRFLSERLPCRHQAVKSAPVFPAQSLHECIIPEAISPKPLAGSVDCAQFADPHPESLRQDGPRRPPRDRRVRPRRRLPHARNRTAHAPRLAPA